MRRLITAILSLSLMLGIFVAFPLEASAACTPGTPGVQLYEYNNLSGDSRLFCGSVSNLINYTHTQPGFCAGSPENTWNNCANSFKVWMAADSCLIFFNGAEYRLAFESIDGPQTGGGYQFGVLDRDTASSFKFYGTECSDI